MKAIQELKKLSPEERIKKLKKLEEDRKKEIQEAQKMIKESQNEIEVEKSKPIIPVPEEKKVDVEKLFEASELEQTVKEEKPAVSEEEIKAHQQYINELALKPTEQLNERVQYLGNRIEDKGYINEDERKELIDTGYAIQQKQESYNASQSVADQMDETKNTIQKLLGHYQQHRPGM